MQQVFTTDPSGKPYSPGTVSLMNCIICFPVLFTPKKQGRKGMEQGDPKYSATFILPKLSPDDHARLMSAYNAVVSSGFPNGMPPTARIPWKTSIDYSKDHPGHTCIGANSTEAFPPEVHNMVGRLSIDQQSQIFSGCIVAASLKFLSYNVSATSQGITAAVNLVKILDNVNVTRLDGGLTADAAFGHATAVEGAPPATAPMPDQTQPAVAPSQQVQPGMVQSAQPGPVAPGAPGIDQLS